MLTPRLYNLDYKLFGSVITRFETTAWSNKDIIVFQNVKLKRKL